MIRAGLHSNKFVINVREGSERDNVESYIRLGIYWRERTDVYKLVGREQTQIAKIRYRGEWISVERPRSFLWHEDPAAAVADVMIEVRKHAPAPIPWDEAA